jgi:membrane protein YqaA with SNARE-associated domain
VADNVTPTEETTEPGTDCPPTSVMSTAVGKRSYSGLWRALLGLVFALGISAVVLVVLRQAEHLRVYGYPGIFVISILSSATIVIPAPSLALVPVMGSVLNPFWVGICAGAGEALGELVGYAAGYSGRAVIEKRDRYERLVTWTKRYGLWIILVLSIIPNPLFDLAGIAAGALRIPLYRFLLTCWIGKTIKTTLFALGGQAVIMPLLHR